MRIALAGAGAFGEKHLDGLKNIPGVTITSIISRKQEQAQQVADKYGAAHATTDLAEALTRDVVARDPEVMSKWLGKHCPGWRGSFWKLALFRPFYTTAL